MKGYFFLHATITVFWLNIAFIAVHSGERCGPCASGCSFGLLWLILVAASANIVLPFFFLFLFFFVVVVVVVVFASISHKFKLHFLNLW